MTAILALDLGTRTGWAVGLDEHIVSGVEEFKNDRFSGGGMRFLRFQRWLDEIAKSAWVEEIVFEEVRRHAGTDAAHCYGGLLGVLTAWCEAKGVPYSGVPVGTIKRHWTGKGNAPKEHMLAVAVSHGFAPKTHDEADALALLHYKLGKLKHL